MAFKRLKKEYDVIKKENNIHFNVAPDDKTFLNWSGVIYGPINTPYYGGIFSIKIFFTNKYPFTPPKIKFITPIFHPNIKNGEICLDTLKNNWSPALILSKVLISLISLLDDPNVNDPLDIVSANLYKKSKIEYFEKAKAYTLAHAC